MALNFAHGSIQWLTTDVLNSTKVVTGLGFAPKALRFYWVGLQSNSPTNATSQALDINRGIGFAVSTTERRTVGSYSQDNAGTSNCGSIARNDAVVVTVDGNGATSGLLDISAFGTDGFTLIVDDVAPVNITVFWEAWGGDITAGVGDIAEPAAIGNQTYTTTVTGFGDKTNAGGSCVMFAGVQSTAALNTGQATDSGLCVGFATSTKTINNITICGNQDDASANADTDGYCKIGECLSMIIVGGGNPNARATLVGYSANGFILNWIARGLTNRRYIYMAIRGESWQAGGITIDGTSTNTAATITPLPFSASGVSMFTKNEIENTVAVATANDRICLGSGLSPTSENSAGSLDEDGLGTTETDLIIQYNSVLSVPSVAGGVQAAYVIVNVGFNSLQISPSVAGGVDGTLIGYLIFGTERKLRNASVGHPFIF
jgi:hypothetical protein